MKNLIIILISFIFLSYDYPPNDELYLGKLEGIEIVVKGSLFDSLKPRKAKDQKDFIKVYRPLFKHIAENTTFTEAQVFALMWQEQGKNAWVTRKYNNPFNVKYTGVAKAVTLKTQEYVNGKMITINDKFDYFPSIQEGAEAFIKYFNRVFAHVKASNNKDFFYQMRFGKNKYGYTVRYHTDLSHNTRAKIANKYEKLLNYV